LIDPQFSDPPQHLKQVQYICKQVPNEIHTAIELYFFPVQASCTSNISFYYFHKFLYQQHSASADEATCQDVLARAEREDSGSSCYHSLFLSLSHFLLPFLHHCASGFCLLYFSFLCLGYIISISSAYSILPRCASFLPYFHSRVTLDYKPPYTFSSE